MNSSKKELVGTKLADHLSFGGFCITRVANNSIKLNHFSQQQTCPSIILEPFLQGTGFSTAGFHCHKCKHLGGLQALKTVSCDDHVASLNQSGKTSASLLKKLAVGTKQCLSDVRDSDVKWPFGLCSGLRAPPLVGVGAGRIAAGIDNFFCLAVSFSLVSGFFRSWFGQRSLLLFATWFISSFSWSEKLGEISNHARREVMKKSKWDSM